MRIETVADLLKCCSALKDKVRANEFDAELRELLARIENYCGNALSTTELSELLHGIAPEQLDVLHIFHAQTAINREQDALKNGDPEGLTPLYDFGCSCELRIYEALRHQKARTALIVGSGYWPKTALFYLSQGCRPICVDRLHTCFDSPSYTGLETVAGDILSIKPPPADMILLASTIGPTGADKLRVVKHLIDTARRPVVIVIRLPFQEESLLFSDLPLHSHRFVDVSMIESGRACRRAAIDLR